MKNLWKYLTLIVIIAAPVELAGYVAARVLLAQHVLVRSPSTDGYAEYLRDRDPVLGWPSAKDFGTGEFDARGSRLVPSFPDPSSPSCVAIFGDSFTWGAEVETHQAYGNVLADLLRCRVANYGIGGYGTDQAVIRFMEKIDDRAPIAILGHFSENIVRNVNQLRDLTSGSRFGFKPRFLVHDDGKLDRVPLPTLNVGQYAGILNHAAELLPHEYFLPGKPGGPVPMAFPYTLAVAKGLMHFRVVARILGVPSYATFYERDHPSGALGVTVGIIRQFDIVAKQRNQKPVVLIIPDEKDLRLLRAGAKLPYETLLVELVRHGIRTPNVASAMIDHLGVRDVCAFFVRCGGSSHFNPEGYSILAKTVHRWLIDTRQVPVAALVNQRITEDRDEPRR